MAVVTVLAVAFAGCESTLLSKVVEVDDEGEAPVQLFAELSTADTVWRVWLNEGLRPDEEGPAEVVRGAIVELAAGSEAFGPFELQAEREYVGFPTDQTDSFDVFAPREVYALRAPRTLQAGEDIQLRVELPDGTVAEWSRRMPAELGAREVSFQPAVRDTNFRDGGYSVAIQSAQLAVAFPLRGGGATSYYRGRVDFALFDTTGALRGVYYDALRPSYEGEADAERAVSSTVTSDERVLGDSLEQRFGIFPPPTFSYRRGEDFEELPPIDSITARVTIEQVDEPSARYYASLDEAKDSERDFFAEPVALGTQVDGLIGHLILATAAEPILIERL